MASTTALKTPSATMRDCAVMLSMIRARTGKRYTFAWGPNASGAHGWYFELNDEAAVQSRGMTEDELWFALKGFIAGLDACGK